MRSSRPSTRFDTATRLVRPDGTLRLTAGTSGRDHGVMPCHTIPSPVGPLTIEERDGAVVALGWDGTPDAEPPTPLLARAAAQLREYFAGERRAFDLPLAPDGSDFQKRVWAAMAEIPYGETETYGALAQRAGSAGRAARTRFP